MRAIDVSTRSFRATLEEVAKADLLVYVVDAYHPSMPCQVEAVEQELEEIGAAGLLPPDA